MGMRWVKNPFIDLVKEKLIIINQKIRDIYKILPNWTDKAGLKGIIDTKLK